MKKLALFIIALVALSSCARKPQTAPVAKGVDLGWLSEMEHDGVPFYSDEGVQMDCIQLMKMHGADAVRLRVWVNHKTGWCNREDVLMMARRVQRAGLRLMIDFHYSDYWADPQTQTIPEYWRDLNLYELCLAVAGHTTEVLEALKNEGITPEWVQIGNETTNGMLWPYGAIWQKDGTGDWTNYARLSNAGYDAAKNIFPNIICITHVDNAFIDRVSWFEGFQKAGGRWDMIGLSHYPFTQDTISPLRMNELAQADIEHLYKTFGVPVMVSEIGTESYRSAYALEVMQDFVARMDGNPAYAGAFYWEPECYGGWRPAEYIPLGWGSYPMGCMSDDGRVTRTLKVLLGTDHEQDTTREEVLLKEWDFYHGDDTIAEQVTIPHDWAISQPFDRSYDLQNVIVVQNGENTPSWKTGRSGGLPWMGQGRYHTTIDVSDTTKCYTLLIDGAMSHADIYLDNEEVCYWPYGYNTFDCQVLPYMKGKVIDVDINLENKPQQSRWYPGAGLYRNVHLITTNRTHIPTFGTHIMTPEVNEESAKVTIDIEVENTLPNTQVITTLLDGDKTVGIAYGQHAECRIAEPKLWSPETPNLYIARTRVYNADNLVDEYSTRFGVRTIAYSAEHGFQLNGKTRKFKGVCNHHDLGPLGAAVHRDALRHQIKMLQDMGCDAIRTSHNMPAPELVELCDEMGMMMMIEPFDVWDWSKTENDYGKEYALWHERDITNMVRNYRNHACVMLWSSGNEVWNQTFPNGADYVHHLQDLFHQLDPTRPVTNGMDQAKSVIYNGFAAAVEIPGFNYRTARYLEAYAHLPQKFLLGSETASTVSSRGVYKLPVVIRPDALYQDNQSSGYDVEYCAWSGLPDQDFQLQDDYDWTIGQFVWTGFDYLGEPSPYDTDAWPSHSSYFGIIDLASLPKDRYYLYRSQWNDQQPTLHLLPHWNWNDGDTVPVFCYTSYPSAELFVNGRSYGKLRFATAEEAIRMRAGETIEGVSQMPEVGEFEIPDWGSAPEPQLLPRYRLMWFDIPYEAGEIKVVAYDEEGKVAETKVIKTALEPYKLVAEWANRDENPDELCYITLKVMDRKGNLCPMADNLITCHSDGFVATANGDAACLDSFVKPEMHAFAGQATFIVRKGYKATFCAQGLKSVNISL